MATLVTLRFEVDDEAREFVRAATNDKRDMDSWSAHGSGIAYMPAERQYTEDMISVSPTVINIEVE